jgi:hypothetical protein
LKPALLPERIGSSPVRFIVKDVSFGQTLQAGGDVSLIYGFVP